MSAPHHTPTISQADDGLVTHKTICRVCANFCAIEVDTLDGRITAIRGDRDDPVYAGYRCSKGVGQARNYDDPGRLLHSVKRVGEKYVRIPLDDAVSEIAERVRGIIDRLGPSAVGMYYGTYWANEFVGHIPVGDAFMDALGSPMVFSAFSLDQPGKFLSRGFHGMWMAPDRSLKAPEVALIIGTNPAVSHQGRLGSPAQLMRDFAQWKTHLIVIDPRRTELARKAHLRLQPLPGEDVAIIAAIIRVVLVEGLEDREFIAANVTGMAALRDAVESFTPEVAAARADVAVEDLLTAARMFGRASRAYTTSGTGPGMSGRGTLFEYLLLSLTTITGQWTREGDVVTHQSTLMPSAIGAPKAQAAPPFPSIIDGMRLRARDLPFSIVGAPASGLAEEILMEGEGQVRGLLSLGGSPATSWPDQGRAVGALRELDLLVHTDVHMSPTAKLADYVIASRLPLELPSTSALGDFLGLSMMGWGYRRAYAHYTPAVVEPPESSEVIPQWELLYRLARELGLSLELKPVGNPAAAPAVNLDMEHTPTSEEILALVHRGSRVPLETVRAEPGGRFFDDPPPTVAARDAEWEARLDVGNVDMLEDLKREAEHVTDPSDRGHPFRLLCRRASHVMNTPGIGYPSNRPRHNVAQMHPGDIAELDLRTGALVEIRSSRAAVRVVIVGDDSLRRGTISMTHSFGTIPEEDDPFGNGANAARLIDTTVHYDRFSGQPRMSAIPVSVTAST